MYKLHSSYFVIFVFFKNICTCFCFMAGYIPNKLPTILPNSLPNPPDKKLPCKRSLGSAALRRAAPLHDETMQYEEYAVPRHMNDTTQRNPTRQMNKNKGIHINIQTRQIYTNPYIPKNYKKYKLYKIYNMNYGNYTKYNKRK